MTLDISAVHFHLAQPLEDFINKKADRLSHRYPAVDNMIVKLKLITPEAKMNKQAVVTLQVPQQEDIVADKTADTFEEALDMALEAVERQMDKVKARR